MIMLTGKVALVTGSTSGIGLGIAQSLAKKNCHIVLNGLSAESEIQKMTNDLSTITKGKVIYQGANLTKAPDIDNMMKNIISEFGSIDIVVNNAGVQHVSPIEDFPVDKWEQIIQLNLTSAFHTIRLSLPFMRQKKWGRIINIASAHGLVGSAQKSAYVASKHGILGLTKVVALEVAGNKNPQTNEFLDITCNAICPGWVLTPLVEKQIRDRSEKEGIDFEVAKIDLLKEKQPSNQFVLPSDIGDLTAFLCSSAARQINGVSVPFDGGWVAQ